MEERDPNGVNVAKSLLQLFSGSFRGIQYTQHPANLPGEAPGKSSNVSWAAREIEHKYVKDPDWSSVLITVMDSQCHGKTSVGEDHADIMFRRYPYTQSVFRIRFGTTPQTPGGDFDRHDSLHASYRLRSKCTQSPPTSPHGRPHVVRCGIVHVRQTNDCNYSGNSYGGVHHAPTTHLPSRRMGYWLRSHR